MGPVTEVRGRHEDRLHVDHAADEEVPVVAHAVGREGADRLVEPAREDEVAARHRDVVAEEREADGRAGPRLAQDVTVPRADRVVLGEPGTRIVHEVDTRKGDEITLRRQRVADHRKRSGP